jgi:hypothetical protein
MVGEKSAPEIEEFDIFRCLNCGTVVVYKPPAPERNDE